MGTKPKKTRQAPIDRDIRPSESRSVWIGGLLSATAVVLILAGAMIARSLGGDKNETISEYELIHAATVGGIERVEDTKNGKVAGSGVKIKKVKGEDYCPT